MGYFVTAENKLCAEAGDIEVNDTKTCRDAAEDFKKPYYGTEVAAEFPRGCYLDFFGVNFNLHIAGSRNSDASQVCKPRGT